MTKVFVSYSHSDETLRAELEKHLSLLQRQGLINVWNDHRILAGADIHEEVSAELERADVVLLLVSADLLNSDYCYGIEMKRALERHASGSATVLPIILRPCDWPSAPFGRLKALPRDGKPVTKWTTLDDAFLDIVRSLRTVLEAKTAAKPETVPPSAVLPVATTTQISKPRSSSLAIAKEFQDIDKERFLDNTFDYIKAFFENSLEELKARNEGVEVKFRLQSAESFTAAIFRGGRKLASCFIRISNGWGDRNIAYSDGDLIAKNSYNESLRVDTDKQTIFLRATMDYENREQKLTAEGAAERLWMMLIRPLQ